MGGHRGQQSVDRILSGPRFLGAVANALDRAGLARPEAFTHEVVFRRCAGCEQLNIVRDEDFVCVFCDADLPREWNARSPNLSGSDPIDFSTTRWTRTR
ncbi:hypothetical protein ACWCXB_03000 [Streptomyces sp. NPDC001514]